MLFKLQYKQSKELKRHCLTCSKPMAIVQAFRVLCWRFMPHLLLVGLQVGYAFLHFMAEAAFNLGMNPSVFVTYRYLIGSLAIFPFAYFLERKAWPKLTFLLLLEINVLSLVGASLTLNMYFASLRYTSPTFVTAVSNTVPAMTFISAIIFRLEIVDVRNPRGIAKILGTLVSLAGVMTTTLYKGPVVERLQGTPIHIRSNPAEQNWIKGSILIVASCVSFSIWYILQAYSIKRYPAKLSLTVLINFIAAVQSAVFAVCMQLKPAAWSIRFNIEMWATIYSGVLSCGLAIFIQLWCTKQKGPVFATMFSPLLTIIAAILAYFLFGEELHTGSIVGGAVIIMGLYLLLWGKEGDQDLNKPQEQSVLTEGEEKVCQKEDAAPSGKEVV